MGCSRTSAVAFATAELAVDLVAETFAQALSSRRRFRSRGEGSSVAWLYGIAGHVLSRSIRHGRVEDRMRRRLALPPLVLDDEELAQITELSGPSGAEDALDGLPADHRAAVRARIIEERS